MPTYPFAFIKEFKNILISIFKKLNVAYFNVQELIEWEPLAMEVLIYDSQIIDNRIKERCSPCFKNIKS